VRNKLLAGSADLIRWLPCVDGKSKMKRNIFTLDGLRRRDDDSIHGSVRIAAGSRCVAPPIPKNGWPADRVLVDVP
jgi:hypothetical protein